MIRRQYLLALAVGGCGLINSNTLSYDYSFDVQHFTASVGDKSASPQTVPTMACDPAAATDICASVPLPSSAMATLKCDATTKQCVALAEVRLPYPVDLSQQSLPSPVVQYTVDGVSIKKIAYWVSNMLNVAVPEVDLYVAPSAAKDETDPEATLLGSMAMLPAGDSACADAVDAKGDSAAGAGVVVCDLKLTDGGKSALAGFVKAYQTPFQFIAHATITARGGDPLPVGSIDYFVHPTVSFSILK
jgi:hypothetical protein